MQSYTLDPELVWGLIPRFLGFIYVLAFLPFVLQHDVIPGSHSLAPMRLLGERVRRDFPGPRRWFEQPSLLWISDSDAMQRSLAVLGLLSGALAIYGGPLGFYALVAAWMIALSLEPRGLMFPWDAMLLEVGFLALFLPTTEPLPSLHASTLPLPSVAFMMRWLVLRLMIGFGKDKFIDTRKSDFLFLRGFFVWMPLPSPLGWFAHHAPRWALKLGLLFMFFAEVIAPVLGLFAGPTRIIAFGSLVALMAGIQVTGNWGYFNLGYALLCVCLLDTQSSIFDLGDPRWAATLTSWPELAVHILMALLFVISLFYLPNNSFLTRSWVNWTPEMFPLARAEHPWLWRLHRALAPLRAIAPFRIVNGYGVFPPHSAPPIRLTPVLEGSADGIHWKRYGYRYMPCFPDSRPPFIAPYHPRFDQWTYYITMGLDAGSLFGPLFPMSNPYAISARANLMDLLAQRLLVNDPRFLRFFGHNPFPDAPPKQIRVGIIAMTPTRPSELRATGHWWHVRRIGTLMPARGVESSWPERMFVPEPEVFHPDLVAFKTRAAPLRAIRAAYAAGASAEQAALAESDLTADDVARFWQELVPMLAEDRGNWSRVHERAAALRARFGVEGLYRHERVLERFVWLLRGVTEPYRSGKATPGLPVMSNFHYHMLMHELVVDGPLAYEAALAEPVRVVERAAQSTAATQLWAYGLLRYDQLMAHVRCFRSSEMGLKKSESGLPGFFEYYGLIADIVPPDEEFQFEFVKHENGEYTIPGFYPPPALTVAKKGTSESAG